jgi:hypothetical protein
VHSDISQNYALAKGWYLVGGRYQQSGKGGNEEVKRASVV